MESLIASYASSDSEGDDQEVQASPPASKSTSLFASLPPPQKRAAIAEGHGLFSSLPAPKKNKGPVVFRPPIDMSALAKDDEKEQRRGRSEQEQEQNMEVIKPGLVLPAPRNTSLGIGASSGRRAQVVHVAASVSIAEADDNAQAANYEAAAYERVYENDLWQQQQQQPSADNGQVWQQPIEIEAAQTQDEEDPVAKALKQERRRGRDEPVTFVEIKQEDLTRNRPREDQLRMTGIAFGTAFDNKEDAENKPSKLHKRKHQIGSLLYDMKQKEFELMERRARGQMSKAQTQAKYGW